MKILDTDKCMFCGQPAEFSICEACEDPHGGVNETELAEEQL